MNKDKCVSFNLDNNAFRGRLVRLDNVLAEVFSHHKYPDNVGATVAETTAQCVRSLTVYLHCKFKAMVQFLIWLLMLPLKAKCVQPPDLMNRK